MARNPDAFDADDLLAELGVEIPWPSAGMKKVVNVECGQKAPKAPPKRHTEWSNHESFIFAGYVAVVVQTTCNCCGSMRENLEGIFTVEVKEGTGARRMQAIAANGDWPAQQEHTCEVRQAFSRWCPDCVRQLGFNKEVEAEGTRFDITIR